MRKQLLFIKRSNAFISSALLLLLFLVSAGSVQAQNTYNICNATTAGDADGILYDSGGPNGTYSTGENCDFLISPTVPAGACLDGIDLDLSMVGNQNNWQALKVYDGSNAAGTALHPNNGPLIQGVGPGFTGTANASLTATSGEVFINWRSATIFAGPGFSLEWEANFVFPITADYVLLSDTVFTGETVTFQNANQEAAYAHEWDLGNDGTIESTATDFTNTFNTPGTFDLKLRTSADQCGFTPDEIVKTIVVVNPTAPPVADFLVDRNVVNVFESATLTDISTNGPIQWTWSITPATGWFALGTLNDPELEVFFIDEGCYEICLISENIIGPSAQTCKVDYICVDPPLDNQMCFQAGSTRSFGNLFDSGGPNGNFNANEQCDFLIEPCGGTSVSFEFSLFVFNDVDDVVRIYDGEDNSGVALHTANGFTSNNLPPLNTPIVANSGKMYIEMRTDNFTQTIGFEGSWTSTGVPIVAASADFDVDPNFTGVLSDTVFVNVPFNPINNSTGDQLEYEWDTDNDNFPDMSGESPDIIFGAPGIYPITMWASNCASSDSKSDSVVAVLPTKIPEIDFTTDNVRPNAGEEVQLFSQIQNGAETVEWTISPATHSFVDPNNSRNPRVTFNVPGLYNVQLKAENIIGSDSLNKVWFIEVIDYCNPLVVLASNDVGISNVTLGTLNNTSPVGEDTYTDYAGVVAAPELNFGGTYDLTVSRLTNFNPANRKAWIDFNKDGDFTDPGEMVLNEPSDTALSTMATFTVPPLADSYEGTTKMRVSAAYGATQNTPCGPMISGEYEDYSIRLVRDDQLPVITLTGADTVQIEVGSTYNDQGATAFDNLEGDISSAIVTDNQVDASQAGIYVVTYNVEDGSGNAANQVTRVVFVLVDLTPPVLTLNGPNPMTVDVFTPFVDPGATATDNYSGNITSSIVVNGIVDTATVGTYVLDYTIQDAFGFMDSEQRTVNVVDQVAPVINGVPTDTFRVNVLTPFVDPVTVTDNYDPFVPSITTGGPVNTNALGTYVLTYTAFDASGNPATPYQLTVIVEDQIAPELTVNAADTIIVDVYDNFTYPTATFSDNFSSVTFTRTGQVNEAQLGNYPVVYAAEDGSGNRTERTIVVQVVDREAPVIEVLGPNPSIWNRWVPYYEPAPAVKIVDNFYSPAVLYNILEIDTADNLKQGSGNTSLPGLFQVKYTVTDPSGNTSATAIRWVDVVETVGIEESGFASYFSVYPNPTAGEVNVDIALLQAEDITVEVFNIVGERVDVRQLGNVLNDQVSLDLSNQAEGVYHIRFSSENNSATKRVVVTK